MKKKKRILAIALIAAMGIGVLDASAITVGQGMAKAAQKEPSLSKSKLKMTVGDVRMLTVKNVKKKNILSLKVKSSGKSVVSVKKKEPNTYPDQS